MIFKELELKGVFEIGLESKSDERGFFMRVYDDKFFGERGMPTKWVQENQSFNIQKSTVRGLHFQYQPHAEAKLVRSLRGGVFFAFVDLRKGSGTLGKWGSVVHLEENKKMLFLPRGFALGMCTLTDNCILHYKMDNYYVPESAETIKWNDPDLGIDWPVQEPAAISEKDASAKSFREFLENRGAV